MSNTEIKKDTLIRTLVLVVALINQLLTAWGYSPLPIDDALIEQLVSTIFTAGAAIWAWWKNNSFTKEAQEADKVMQELKENKNV